MGIANTASNDLGNVDPWNHSSEVRPAYHRQSFCSLTQPPLPVYEWREARDERGNLYHASKLAKMYVGRLSDSPYSECGTLEQLSERLRTHLERKGDLPEGFSSMQEAWPDLAW